MPLSESLELADRPETEDTEEAVETDRSSRGMAPRASEGVTHGSGDKLRSGGGEAVVSMAGGRQRTWRVSGDATGATAWRGSRRSSKEDRGERI